MVTGTAEPTLRRAAILEAATGVFQRYGYKKTSMDDVARAADLSRQGLYLHFATKDQLFKAVVQQVIDRNRRASRAALAREDLDLAQRILGAFEAVHGFAVGQQGSEHMDELLATAGQLLGPVVAAQERDLVADVARVLADGGVADSWAAAGASAPDLAEHLYATSSGLKHCAATRAEYHERMGLAVRMVCQGGAR
jgi:AcrR family transcriptional regulator